MAKRIVMGLVVSTSLVFGSATVFSGSSQNLTFNSKPEGATVILDGLKKCTTPCSVTLDKDGKSKQIFMEKEGYETGSATLDASYDGVALLNIFWDFSTTDLISGSAYKYSPETFYMELKAK